MAKAVRDNTSPDVDLRNKSEWEYLGKSIPRTDMVAKSTGTAHCTADTKLDGLKFATVRINPRHSGLVSYDDNASRDMTGVEAIVDLGDGMGVSAYYTWLAIQATNAVGII